MTVDISKLSGAYERYIRAVTNTELPEADRRIDLKHMRFWYPYHAQVVEAIATNKKPQVERRTLTAINAQSQIDYESLTNQQIFDDIHGAQKILLRDLPKISEATPIPYRKSTRYLPEKYVDTLVDHLQMHWEYLEKLK